MADYNRPVSEATGPKPLVHRSGVPKTGPIFESLDFVAGIVAAAMILGPLAMAAYWAPYH
jgi:hypothetical protein